MLAVVGLHFLVALIAPLLYRWRGRLTFYALALIPLAGFVWLVAQYPLVYTSSEAQAGAMPQENFRWIPALEFSLSFRMDSLSWVMGLLVLGVGSLVLCYCASYFKKNSDRKTASFAGQLVGFAGVMFGLVTADDLMTLFLFWELTTVLSYLLIGYASDKVYARRSAIRALMVTTFGGLAMLIGFIMIGEKAGTYKISAIVSQPEQLLSSGAYINAAIILVLLGAISKSALVPFHFWLPGAMAAPTPVSAYLHAAAMVKAGIYLIARLAVAFSAVSVWKPTIITLGVITMILGGWRALRQTDLKLILAYGTVSQLGLMVLVLGLGTYDTALVGMALVAAHGLFKALLFLVVGIIDHETGVRDIRKLSGIFRQAPALAVIATIGAASMAGVPPLAGFIAKEGIYESLAQDGAHDGLGPFLLGTVVLGSVLTFAYSARFIWGAFATKNTGQEPAEEGEEIRPGIRVRPLFMAAPAVLALLTLLYGLLPQYVDGWLRPYSENFVMTDDKALHLALSHPLGWPLYLTVFTYAAGIALFVWRGPLKKMQRLLACPIDAERIYRRIINGVDIVSIWVTAKIQRGSLFFYLTVILGVATAAPIVALFSGGLRWPQNFVLFDSYYQGFVGLVIVVGAVLTILAKKRFAAVLMASVSGYSMALNFSLQGAPDLALTQMLVESIVLVAVVLALRSLPAELKKYGSYFKTKVVRVVISLGFGITVVVVAFFAMAARQVDPISFKFPDLAVTQGHGDNIVNVTLVDIRAWDTLGEISVIAVAAIGVVSLIFVKGHGRLRRAVSIESGSIDRAHRASDEDAGYGADVSREEGAVLQKAALGIAERFVTTDDDDWITAGHTLAPERRSIMMEVMTRFVFHALIIFSLYLLFAGHNRPGGGFAAGLLVGVALVLRYLAGGRFELAEALPISTGWILGVGLALSSASALLPVFWGDYIFTTYYFQWHVPLLGEIHFVTSVFFDVGVYLIVIGLCLDVLRSFGGHIDEQNQRGAPGIVYSDDNELESRVGR